MCRHAGTQHGTGKIAANEQLNGTGIPVGSRRFHDRAHGLIPFAGNKDAMCAFA